MLFFEIVVVMMLAGILTKFVADIMTKKREDKEMSYAHKVFEKDGVRVVKTDITLFIEEKKAGQGWISLDELDTIEFLMANFPITERTVLKDENDIIYIYTPETAPQHEANKIIAYDKNKDSLGAPVLKENFDVCIGWRLKALLKYYYTQF